MSGDWRITDGADGGKGLPLRSRRGPIGVSWWAQRWLALFEVGADRQELELGRRLARQARVLELAVTPGRIAARVEETHQRVVAQEFPAAVLTAAQQRRLVAAAVQDTLTLALLYADRLPPDLEARFAAVGAALLPAPAEHFVCGCGVAGGGCRHAIAMASAAAERFDADPFLLLAWHGLDRRRLTNLVRDAWGAPPLPERRPERPAPLAADLAVFHRCPAALPRQSGSLELPALSVLECLGEPPFFPPTDPPPGPTLADLYQEGPPRQGPAAE